MTRTIEIFRGEEVWLLKISVVSAQGRVGTDALPTPFRSPMPACEVKARLQRLNPDARIIFWEEAAPS